MFYGDWLHRRELLSPKNIAIIGAENNDLEITYQQWNSRVNRMANYKVPKSMIFPESLPKTGANKIDKKLLANHYNKTTEGM